MDNNIFQLYVAGVDLLGNRAIKNMKLFCEKNFINNYNLEIVDIEKNPEMAIKNRINAIPTLIKIKPLPEVRIIGDLAEVDQLAADLGF